jgi:hypothetical protein
MKLASQNISKLTCLVGDLNAEFAEPAKFEKTIKADLKGLGYAG